MAANRLPTEMIIALLEAAARDEHSVKPLVALGSISKRFQAVYAADRKTLFRKRLEAVLGQVAPWSTAVAKLTVRLMSKPSRECLKEEEVSSILDEMTAARYNVSPEEYTMALFCTFQVKKAFKYEEAIRTFFKCPAQVLKEFFYCFMTTFCTDCILFENIHAEPNIPHDDLIWANRCRSFLG